jgi:hypothetical protein
LRALPEDIPDLITEVTSTPAGLAPPARRSFAAMRHGGFRAQFITYARHDGGQYQACDQLLSGSSEIPFAGARQLCHRRARAAVPAVLGGVSVGLLGSVLGVHWSLALSALATVTVAGGLLAIR